MKWWLLILCVFASPCLAQPSTGYANATPDAPITDGETAFTFVVDLSALPASWWTEAENTDATRGRVYRNDGTTQLACDFIDYNHGAQTGFVRFKDTAALSPTTYRIYPPVAANATVAAADTYGQYNAYDANWEAYWPLTDLNDRTSHGHTLTAVNTPTSGATGKIGAAYDLDRASSEYLTVATGVVTATPCTIMSWASYDAYNLTQGAVSLASDTTDDRFALMRLNTDAIRAQIAETGFFNAVTTATAPDDTTYAHLAGTYSSSSVEAYLNATASGSPVAHSQVPSTIDRTALGALWSAGSPDANYHDGRIDEVQIHSVERSAEWIAYEYAQTNDNAAFWNTWTWNAGSSGASIPVIIHHQRQMRQ